MTAHFAAQGVFPITGRAKPGSSERPNSGWAAQGRAPTGDVDADAPFAEIVHAYAPYIWRVLRCVGVRDADVDDLCQETLMVVQRKLPSFERKAALRSWIYGIAIRVASDYRRRAHHKREMFVDPPHERSTSAHPEQELQQRRDWELLDRLVGSLVEEQRNVFVLYEVEQLTMHEVSAIVGCPLQTAYYRLHAARKRIADALDLIRATDALS
jgi:RNA polymerase sigma-70 factor (ECF subfamily)